MLSPIMNKKSKKLNIVNLGSNSISYTYGGGYDVMNFTRTVTIDISSKISSYNKLGLTKDNFIIGLNSINSQYGDVYAKVTGVSHSYSSGKLTIKINCTSLYGGNFTVSFSAYCAYIE